MSEPISLVKALRDYFEISGSTLIAEFKTLTDQDKADFVAMFAAEYVGGTPWTPATAWPR